MAEKKTKADEINERIDVIAKDVKTLSEKKEETHTHYPGGSYCADCGEKVGRKPEGGGECSECGTKVHKEDKFCYDCGEKLGGDSDESSGEED